MNNHQKRRNLVQKIGDASALLIIGAVMTPIIAVGATAAWVTFYHFLAARSVVQEP
tara:strand:- start:640 stop:807 length:168 start_codon:yes stop_codon:yes gene_type:complete